MEEQTNRQIDRNPWSDRSEFPSNRDVRLYPMAVLFAVACLAFPLSAVRIAPYPIAALLIGGMGWLTWKHRGGFWLTLAVAAVLAPVPAFGASLGFLVLAASVGVCSGAYLFTVQGRPYLPVAGSALAFAISFAVTGNAATASLAVFLLPAALLLGGAVLLGERRVTLVTVAAAGLAVALAGGVVWFVVRRGGAFTAQAILAIINDWKASLIAFLTEQYAAALSTFRATAGTANAAPTAMLEQMFSAAAIKTYADSIFNLAPAFLIILCEIPAFLGQKLLNAAYATNRLGHAVGLESEFFAVGVPTAVIWLFTFLLSFFGTPTSNLFFAVTENLRYLLLPVVFVAGVRTVYLLYRRVRAGAKTLFWLTGIAILCCSPASAVSLFGLFGAYDTIMRSVRRSLARKLDDTNRGNDNNDRNGNDDE
ncbi:MAG: hypothetical protein II955_03450 [Clostridia bacterium]|nr:hypothetical protein [Clostridia bacterium]